MSEKAGKLGAAACPEAECCGSTYFRHTSSVLAEGCDGFRPLMALFVSGPRASPPRLPSVSNQAKTQNRFSKNVRIGVATNISASGIR